MHRGRGYLSSTILVGVSAILTGSFLLILAQLSLALAEIEDFSCKQIGGSGECRATASSSSESGVASEQNSPLKWIDDVSRHRCNITRLSRAALHEKFGSDGVPKNHPFPLIISNNEVAGGQSIAKMATYRQEELLKFIEMTSIDSLSKSSASETTVTLSSSSNAASRRRTMLLAEYLDEIREHKRRIGAVGLGGITPGNLTADSELDSSWYFFRGLEWKHLLSQYPLPPCEACTDRKRIALAFGIGTRGSGVQWHSHGAGFSHVIHGRKHWMLYPPDMKPKSDPTQSTVDWMDTHYSDLATANEVDAKEEAVLLHVAGAIERADSEGDGHFVRRAKEDALPWECTLEHGDIIYFPDKYYHATINLDFYTVFVTTFVAS